MKIAAPSILTSLRPLLPSQHRQPTEPQDRVELGSSSVAPLVSAEISPRFAMFEQLDASKGTLRCKDAAPLRARAQSLAAQGTALVAIRHGESEANAAGGGALLSGRGDSPLTDLGRQQARQAAEELWAQFGKAWSEGQRTPVLYSSPLSRAFETAQALQELLETRGIQASLIAEPDLQEIDFGHCEGRNAMEVSAEYPNFGRGTDFTHRFPGGESGLDVMARVDRFLGRAAHHAGQDVLFFGHTMTVGLTRMLLGEVEHNEQGQLRIDRKKIPNAHPMVLVSPASEPEGYILR